MKPTVFTWIIAIFGLVTFLPLFVTQIFMLLKPDSRTTKDLIIGKGEDWRDRTHFKSALAFAWGDILVLLPIFVAGNIGKLGRSTENRAGDDQQPTKPEYRGGFEQGYQ